MGSQICHRDNQQQEITSWQFRYIFGQDDKYLRIAHKDRIKCHNSEIQKNLLDCEEKLIRSQKLFKDKLMKTDPIILKSLNGQDNQVKCTFQRPYVFLKGSTKGSGQIYKIMNELDCRPSQIIVRDEALQYFGVFLCFLADNPYLINQIILTEPNTYGIHCLKMNIQSVQQPIYIDDYILCNQLSPLFVQPIKGQYMWTCLLEKAWLKVNVSITDVIHKIQPEEVFSKFLPYPMRSYLMKENTNQNYNTENQVDTFNLKLLKECLYGSLNNKGCIITTKQNPKHKIGISGRKNFYLLKIFDLKGQKLYYLRNPCSQAFHFRGKRSQITEQLSQAIGKISKEQKIPQGNFVLEEGEILQQVESFFVVRYEINSTVFSEQILRFKEETELFVQFQLFQDGFVSICLNQQSKTNKQNVFCPLSYLIISETESKTISDLHNLEGCFGVKETYLLENLYANLKAGKYLMRFLKKKCSSKGATNGNLSDKLVATAPFTINFRVEQQSSLKIRFENFLKDLGLSKMTNGSQKKKPKEDFSHIGYWIGDLAVIYIKSNTEKSKKQLKLEVEFSQLQNLQCISNSMLNNFIVLEHIENEHLVIFEKIDLAESTKLGKYVIQSF